MFVVLGLIILIAAVVVGVAGVFNNDQRGAAQAGRQAVASRKPTCLYADVTVNGR